MREERWRGEGGRVGGGGRRESGRYMCALERGREDINQAMTLYPHEIIAKQVL